MHCFALSTAQIWAVAGGKARKNLCQKILIPAQTSLSRPDTQSDTPDSWGLQTPVAVLVQKTKTQSLKVMLGSGPKHLRMQVAQKALGKNAGTGTQRKTGASANWTSPGLGDHS